MCDQLFCIVQVQQKLLVFRVYSFLLQNFVVKFAIEELSDQILEALLCAMVLYHFLNRLSRQVQALDDCSLDQLV